MLSVRQLQIINVIGSGDPFLCQLFDQVQRVIDRVDDTIPITVLLFIQRPTLKKETLMRSVQALAYALVHDPMLGI
jgi:hypothetical protein